jgi:chaperone BCS1
MTTNMLETLDPALIRPGRVDLKIKFTLATNDQICDIYRRMYNVEIGISMEEKTHQMTKVCGMTRTAARNNPTHQHLDGGEIPSKTRLPPEELETMATQFASKFPTETFSPAEIQGFLLRRRTSPEVALQEVNVWREEQLKAKSALREIGTEG